MPVFQIENPFTKKIEQVELDTDNPTDDQLDEVMSFFQQESGFDDKVAEIDFGSASLEEIQDYRKKLIAAGIDPKTKEQISEEDFISEYKEVDVDYDTGLDSVGGFSRFQFGRMDTDQEKAGYLQTVVGDTGFRTDALGRFILTKDGRNKLGLGEGKELAIDEEGFTFNDVKEFAGATALPIVSGIGATIAASGVGFVPGMLIVGAATAGGKLLDEGIEYAEGLQKQSFADVARDSALEGAFGFAGEGVGRGLSKLFGRIIKGPGGEANEVLRKNAREYLEKNFRPTVAGATSEGFRPILNRLQAVYEGIFPNEAAAQQNLNLILKEMQGFGITDNTAIKNLGEVVRKDISDFYTSGNKTLANMQTKFNNETTKEIEKIIGNLRTEKVIPKDLGDMIRMRKRQFDEDIDKLYTKIHDTLGGQKFVPVGGIKQALSTLEKNTIADIGTTKFARMVRDLGKGSEFATIRDVTKIRTGLLEATKNPALLNDINVGALQTLKKSIDDAIDDSMLTLSNMSKGIPLATDPASMAFISSAPKLDITAGQAAEGLGLLSRTNKFYKSATKRFDNVVVAEIMEQANKGQLNTNFIFDEIVLKDNPEAFGQLMRAIRGAPTGKALGRITGITDLDEGANFLAKRQLGGRSTKQALNDVADLPQSNSVRKDVLRRAGILEREAAEVATIRGSGAEIADQVRQTLAKKYLEKMVNESLTVDPTTGLRVVDSVKLAANVRQKGTTVDRLFRNEFKQLEDTLKVLEVGKSNLAPQVIANLRQLPLGQSLLRLKTIQQGLAKRQKDQFTQILQSTNNPDVLAANVFSDVASIKKAKRILKGRTSNIGGRPMSTFEAVQDSAMGRILKQIGATVDDQGAVKMTDDFVDAFKSGRLGTKFQNVLRTYGPETLDEMFGRGASDGLNALAEQMVKVSNASITGKGGLAAPQIALALSSIAFIMNPLATASTAAGYAIMSKALRNPTVLKMMMASRKPNSVKEFLSGKFKANDPIAQGFQTMLALSSAAAGRGIQLSTTQAEEEARPMLNLQQKRLEPQVNKAITNIKNINIPNVTPPASAGSATNINPILVPNAVTRATVGSQ